MIAFLKLTWKICLTGFAAHIAKTTNNTIELQATRERIAMVINQLKLTGSILKLITFLFLPRFVRLIQDIHNLPQHIYMYRETNKAVDLLANFEMKNS